MKKMILLMAAALITLAGTVQATMLTNKVEFFTDYTNSSSPLTFSYGGEYLNKLEYTGDYVRWDHTLDLNYSVERLLGATLTVTLRDNEKDKLLNPFTWEFAALGADTGYLRMNEVNTGKYSLGVNLDDLADNKLIVSLTSLWGDFFIDKSVLTVRYEEIPAGNFDTKPSLPSTPVPEPNTAMLLGSSLIGLAGFFGWKRRKS